jgi:type I restriction enzyme S subunit
MEVREPSAKYLERPAYKQTEVGSIPEDWQVCALGAMTDPKRPISYGIVQTGPSIQNGVRCLRVVDIENGHINKTDLITTTQSISNAYKRTILQAGDLVMPLRGKVGDVALIDDELAESNLTRGVALIAILRDHSALYCKHFIASPATRARLLQSMNGSALQEIPIAPLRAFEIAFPSTLAEQQAIAEALSDADALIESLEQLLAKKRHIKQGAMQELLTGQKRLPGFMGQWEVKWLGDLADIRSGGTPSTSRPEFWDGDVLWCTPTDITGLNGYKYLGDTSRKITALGLKASSAEIIPPRSVVMTSRATIGECAINCAPLSTNQGFKNFIPFAEVDVEFLYYLLTTQKQGFISLCGGSTFLEIGKTQLAAYEVFIPPTKSEQTAIATLLADMDAELAALEAKLAKARDLKQGMMQELLTGRIRLV